MISKSKEMQKKKKKTKPKKWAWIPLQLCKWQIDKQRMKLDQKKNDIFDD